MRSFDAPRPRPAPDSFRGLTLDGESVERFFTGLTLVVAIKPDCDGCRDFLESSLDEFGELEVLLVSAQFDPRNEWKDSRHEIVVAPDLLSLLEIRWPPFYVLIDPRVGTVLVEGVVFGPGQVAQEIKSYVTP